MGMPTKLLDRCDAEPGDRTAESSGRVATARDGTPGQPAIAPAQPRLLRRARLVALAVGGFLLPWCVLLGAMLPATAQAQHWSLAWTGLDAAEALAALATALLLARGDRRAALTAMAGATLLLTDAWFDVCTAAPGLDHALALSEAAFVEVPLALAASWLAWQLPDVTC